MTSSFHALARCVRDDLAQRKRYAHSIRVARLAASLARAHGDDAERARVAGVLHDLARLYSVNDLLFQCDARSMPIDAFERRHPVVLHARLGAELARERYGIEDELILNAIRRHTLGDAHMTRLDVLLYLADGLEPGRHFTDRASILREAYRNLSDGMRRLLAATMSYQTQRGLEVAPATLAAAARFNAPGVRSGDGKEGPMEDRLCPT